MTQAWPRKAEHGNCGKTVFWVPKENGGWYPPMDFGSEQVEVLVAGKLAYGTLLKRHQCDHVDIENWAKIRIAKLKASEEERQVKVQYASNRIRAWEQAVLVDCPKCGAVKSEKCFHLPVFRKSGIKKDVAWPHQERLSKEVKVSDELS